MKNFLLENYIVTELKTEDLKEISGGGWLADFIEKFLCGCPVERQTSTRWETRKRELTNS